VKSTVNQDLSNSQAKSHGSDAIRTKVSKIPWVTLLLIASNIAVAFWAVLNPNFANDYGFRASEPTLLTFFTNLFVHANTLHLMANMVFLAAVGAAVEIATGSLRFSIVFFLSGSLGTVLYWLALRSTVEAPVLVGASGGIAGCATYFSLKYTKLRVSFAPKRSTSVAIITMVWLALQLTGAIIKIGEPVTAAAFLAHLGGGLGGLLLRLVFHAPDLGSKLLGHAEYEALIDQGPLVQIEHLKNHIKTHPEDMAMQIKLANEYRTLGDNEDEKTILLNVLFQLESSDQVAVVTRLMEINGLNHISPTKRRMLADNLPLPTSLLLLNSIVDMPKSESQRPEALLDIVRHARNSDDQLAENALQILKSDYPTHPTLDIARQRGWLS